MRRREFLGVLGSTAIGWPLSVRAQQPMLVIGYLGAGSPSAYAELLPAFHRGLAETGHVAGRNVTIEFRWAEGHSNGCPSLQPIWFNAGWR